MKRKDRARERKRKQRAARLRHAMHARSNAAAEPGSQDSILDELAELKPRDEDNDGLDDDVWRPSPFLSERALRRMKRFMDGQDFQESGEVDAYLASFAGKKVDEIGADLVAQDPREQAQELAYRALEVSTRENAAHFAHKALAIDPDCTDALAVLATRCVLEGRVHATLHANTPSADRCLAPGGAPRRSCCAL